MKKSKLLLLSLCLFSGLLISCSEDNKGNGGGNENYLSATVKATEYGEWTYFDLTSGTSRTLKIKGEDGAVTGIYYGDFSSTFIKNADSLQLIITRYTSDSVTVSLPEILMGQMNSDGVDTLSLSANAKAQKRIVINGLFLVEKKFVL